MDIRFPDLEIGEKVGRLSCVRGCENSENGWECGGSLRESSIINLE